MTYSRVRQKKLLTTARQSGPRPELTGGCPANRSATQSGAYVGARRRPVNNVLSSNNSAKGPVKLCSPCRASDERDCGHSQLFAGDSPVRTEIAVAGSHLAQGLFRLVELVVGLAAAPWYWIDIGGVGSVRDLFA